MLYLQAALVIDDLKARKGSVKSLAKKHARTQGAGRVLALAIETLKCSSALEELVQKAGLLALVDQKLLKGASPISLLSVLVHDLLFTTKGVQLAKEHKLRKEIEKHATRLRAEKERLKIRRKVTSDKDLKLDPGSTIDETVSKYRYLRINTIKWSVDEALAWLDDHSFRQEDIASLTSNTFAVDEHIPHLLSFDASLVLSTFQPYRDGRLIAQDKASCMPPFILLAGQHDEPLPQAVIDATAAPGNKTSCLSALLAVNKSSRVEAFERDANRFKTLTQLLAKAGCKNVHARHGDFMKLSTHSKATHVLVDPSCSGSGMSDRLDYLSTTDDKEVAARLRSLADFQVAILSHALRLKHARRVTYSTCSIHHTENEDVIARILAKPDFAHDWSVAHREQVIPSWHRRGDPHATLTEEQSQGMIRCKPGVDGTHGFFVCLLIKDTGGVEEEWQGISSESE